MSPMVMGTRWFLAFATEILALSVTVSLYDVWWAQSAGNIAKIYYELIMFSITVAACAATSVAPRRHWKIAAAVFIGIAIMFYSHGFFSRLVLGGLAPINIIEFGSSLIGGLLALMVMRGMHAHAPQHHQAMVRPGARR
jgi:hypothetical protein